MKPGIIVLFVIGLILFVVATWLNTPKGKGWVGETLVRIKIGKTKEGKRYILNNYIVLDEGKSSQIDHIVINRNGVFVIETKNYSGRIYGNENQQQWSQVLAYGKVKNKLYNPLKQNATHIYRVSKILEDKVKIKSLIVFVQNNTNYITANNVIKINQLKRALNRGNVTQLTAEQMKSIYETLLASRANKIVSSKTHVQSIAKMKEDIEKGICPRCGGELVQRNGQNGTFIGCSNYPKCRFIKK